MQQTSAVVTGAGSGLGRAFCEQLADERRRIVVSDIDEAGARQTADLVRQRGGEAEVVRCDVADPAQVEALHRAARELCGDVDLLVNNAGVAVGGPIDEVTLEDWRWIVDINLWGVIHGCRTFLPDMKARGRGAIINVASLAGLVSSPTLSPYNVTKAGVVALSETMHGELRGSGIHVSVLCPSFFTTNIARNSRGAIEAKALASVERLMARSRVQAPQVARAALDSVARNRLYVVPMSDARTMWRLQRLQPARFYHMLGSRLLARLIRR